MDYRNLCQNCGADLRKVDATHYACECCNTTYSTEKIESYAKKLDDTKRELISNARKNLYAAISEKYISAEDVHSSCVEIKKYLPDDYQANFYEAFLTMPTTDISKMIRKIDVKENFESIELMLTFLIKSLEQEFILDVAALIERTYKSSGSKNLVKYHEYETKLSIEAQKINDGMYNVNLPRDIFVAYSSADMEQVLELVDELENKQGLECFISVRNLRQGAGSRENYIEDLQTAMDNCKSFVFVSSKNSRRQACDALRIELPYIKKRDIERSAAGGYLTYEEIPHNLKKPRVEYRLEESDRDNAADRIVDEFFSGYQRVYSPVDVAERVMRQTTPMKADVKVGSKSKKNEVEIPVAKKVKFCVSCLSKCYEDMEQCDVCGETNFASSLNEAKTLNKEEKERRKKKEKLQKQQKKEKAKKDKENQENQENQKNQKNQKKNEYYIEKEQKTKRILLIIACILAVGLIVLGIIFEALRAWTIAGVVSVAYVAIWNLIRKKTEIYYVPWCIFTNVCVAIAIIPLACISSTRPYAFCFALALLMNSSGLIFQCWNDVTVETKRQKVGSGWGVKYEDVTSYSFKFGPWEYLLNLYSIFIGIILFSVSIGVLFTGMPRSIIIGCGMGIAYIAMVVITKIYLYTTDLEGAFLFIFIAGGIVCLIFAFLSYYFALVTICAVAGAVIAALMLSIFYRDSWWYTCLVVGIILAGVTVLTLLFMHVKPVDSGFKIEDGVLVSYTGTEEVVVIPDEVVEIGEKAFCFSGPKKNMKEVVFHNGVKKIGENAFKKCSKLEKVVILGSIETISDYAFYECNSLKDVVFEEGVSEISFCAFDGCKSIKEIQLPKSLKTLGSYAFSDCPKLEKMYIRGGIETIGAGVLSNNADIIIYYEGSESDWNNIDKEPVLWIKWTSGIGDYEIIFNTAPPATEDATESTTESTTESVTESTTDTTETSEPAMYCIVPQKSKFAVATV